jgi:CheY-like chemotaxis protein
MNIAALMAFLHHTGLVSGIDLAACVERFHGVIGSLVGERIEVVTRLGSDLPPVRCEETGIFRVLSNLAANARDAMPKGGKLTIETANAELDASYAAEHPTVRPGPHVMLAVRDTGVGMDAETRSHIFEPFFTTKEAGKGTGLGLATSYGIVSQSEGHIFVYSEPGHGTSFKIYLPRAGDGPEPAASARAAEGPLPTGTETILLAEDEEIVRLLARELLQRLGYVVLEARSGVAALEIAGRHKGPIHLLLTDVVMPRMSGRELAQALASGHPETRVLYMSGYTGEAIVRHGVVEPGVAFLQKPFTPGALARRIRKILESR